MKDISWDAYQIFLTVARHGGLTGAAQASGLSPATVGRRVLDLEQGIGRQLFSRSQTGYRLTVDGQALFEQLQGMDAVVRKVETWRQEAHGSSVVRLMAGTWGTWLICENIQAIRSDRDGFRLDMSVSERRATLAHREHDIGIRAVVPDEPYLARRHGGEVAYAAYRQRNAPDGLATSWLAVSDEDAISPYLRWPHENAGASIAVIVSRPRSLLDLARAGAGQAVLPCFVGDLDPGLERAGDELKTLRHAQWVVTNNEDRHRRDIRTVSERLFRLLKSHADLIAGKRPSRSV
ncbi:LysR family transcriptional regulator [Pararhizobium polonicum]|jgi:DNA-binding transcriptional LysR family regulator|uniref:LysR family transcriptional regulator n=1 Tax=Pararhizobium polonicum TaxID=1612624 RepID=A0A1C7NUT3_9HYPH|nr:LysR family transcriptional regulator [Pararhizobium polonicum]OBZ92739.1 LysR family transcriptional regulator [Pararhizobium polonicum]